MTKEERVANFAVQQNFDLERASDDVPERVLFMTFWETWVLNELRGKARQIHDGTERVAVPDEGVGVYTTLDLTQDDLDEETIQDIILRLEKVGLIEQVCVTGAGEIHVYRPARPVEDFRIVEIDGRPNFDTPKVHWGLLKRVLNGEGPDPNTSTNWMDDLTAWLKSVKFYSNPTVTISRKIRGYTTKLEGDRRTYCATWGIWFYDKPTSLWIRSTQEFPSVNFVINNKPALKRVSRWKKNDPLVGDGAHSEPQSIPDTDPAPPAVSEPDEQDQLPSSNPIDRLRQDLTRLEDREDEYRAANAKVEAIEKALEKAREEVSHLYLTPEEERRLEDLRTAARVLISYTS